MYAVRVTDLTGLEGADYQTVYGDCPREFEALADAQVWAEQLNTTGNWPMGNPGYEVVEL